MSTGWILAGVGIVVAVGAVVLFWPRDKPGESSRQQMHDHVVRPSGRLRRSSGRHSQISRKTKD